MAAETYPTELRGTFHGLSAYFGKLGALIANIGFGFLSSKEIFWVSGACSVVGLVFTLFSVDLTGVSLAEHDAQLELLYDDKLHRYKGKLNYRKHPSNFEVWTGRHGGMYDPGWVRKIVHEEKTVSSACMVEKKKIRGADDEAKDSDRTFVAQT
jgi:hypothetical protein